MATTVRKLLEEAFREAGILGLGNTLKPEDFQSGLRRLNWMLAQWRTKRWLVYKLVNLSVDATGVTAYTIGPAGDIEVTERPSKIYGAFFQHAYGGSFSGDFDDDFDVNTSGSRNTDYPLQVVESRQTYNLLVQKRQIGDPSLIYYEPDFPLGKFYLWPVPPANSLSIVITCMALLQDLSNLNTEVELPGEYAPALHYNLATRLRAAYGKAPNLALNGLAQEALQVIRGANSQVPVLRLPSNLPRIGMGAS
jgi:hypothetical protein